MTPSAVRGGWVHRGRSRARRAQAGVLARGDSGNAMVEFVYLAVLLMVPLVYVLLSVFRVQAAAYSVSSAAREAGRVFVTAPSVEEGKARAHVAARLVMGDSSLELGRRDLRITCEDNPCLQPGDTVTVSVDHDAPLPWLPGFFGFLAPSVHVSSTHVQLVDRYRSVGS